MKKKLLLLTTALAVWLVVSPASAVIVNVIFTGTVSSGYDYSGVFGPANSDLTGYAYTTSYTFDTTKGSTLSSSELNYATGGSEYGTATPSLGAVVTINGHTLSIGGNYYGEIYGRNYSANGIDPAFSEASYRAFDNYDNFPNNLIDNYVENGVYNHTQTIPASITMPYSYTVTADDFAGGDLNVETFAYIDGILSSSPEIFARANFAPMSFTVSTVTPIPAALPLFAMGLGAFGLLGWRRKRKGAAVGFALKSMLVCASAFLALLSAVSKADAVSYAFTTLDVPGATTTEAYGVNDSGQIVGRFYNGSSLGFLYNGGVYNTLSDPSATEGTVGVSINKSGQIVGVYDPGPLAHGFLYSGGIYTTLTNPSATKGTFAYGINNAGQIVGSYSNGTGDHGFLLNGGIYTTLNVPSATSTLATAINNTGQVVGYFTDGSGDHGFLLSGGVYTTLDDPSATGQTYAWGINDKGDIVGFYSDAGATFGFLYSGGVYTTLDDPLATNGTLAFGINNDDEIVGDFNDATGLHGFIASETPLPAALPLFASGLGALGLMGWRRKRRTVQ